MRFAFFDLSVKDELKGDKSTDRETCKKTISVVQVTRYHGDKETTSRAIKKLHAIETTQQQIANVVGRGEGIQDGSSSLGTGWMMLWVVSFTRMRSKRGWPLEVMERSSCNIHPTRVSRMSTQRALTIWISTNPSIMTDDECIISLVPWMISLPLGVEDYGP